jgi:predicted Rossmann fold flavoprotein
VATRDVETLVLGAGAAGLWCAGRAGVGVLVVDHARAPAEKVRISGGGRCNFTNLGTAPERFVSRNPHFAKGALARHTARDFLDAVERHRIPWHEKAAGQLFCDRTSRDIVGMLMAEAAGAEVWLETTLGDVGHDGGRFVVATSRGEVRARHLVVATGGKSIPKMGATGLGYRIAERFGLAITETRAGLVPFTFPDGRFAPLAGVALPVRATAGGAAFEEPLLFTHRGLSGPAMLQASSYWREGQDLVVDLLPGADVPALLAAERLAAPRRPLRAALARHLPARVADHLATEMDFSGEVGRISGARAAALARSLGSWALRPAGTEGYRTAEVTLGGVDTDGLDGRTMEARTVPGLFFIGEVVDVTGWLGGYNFQWAWSSADAAARAIRARGGA